MNKTEDRLNRVWGKLDKQDKTSNENTNLYEDINTELTKDKENSIEVTLETALNTEANPKKYTTHEMNFLITPNIVRAIKKVKNDTTKIFINDLVDPTIRKEFNELFNIADNTREEFSINREFQEAYQIVKTNLVNNPDDTQLLNTAQRFLQFMLNNELKINGIDAVKNFKEAVFTVLDEQDMKLKDKVIDKFNSMVEV